MPRRTSPQLTVYERAPAARVVAGTRIIPDSSERFLPALDWLGGEGKDAQANAELRAEGLLTANKGLITDMGVDAEVARRKGKAGLLVRTSTRVGAIPLLSPVTGRPDFGLVVEPRFSWSSVGDLLAATGFRILPELLPLPEMPHSERRVPPWVLSSVVIARLERLLAESHRRFVLARADLPAPRGTVDWEAYARSRLPTGRALQVPCTFPDLRDDELLRSAILFAVRKHRDALLGQRAGGAVVRGLIERCEQMMRQLGGAPSRIPSPTLRASWHRRPLSSAVFSEGLRAIDWTVDERGLAGLSDVSGLSWRMEMEVFFEAWVETLAHQAARRSGCILKVGRKGETRVPLHWHPPHAGSQRSLIPDVVLQREDTVVVLDAKYKRHAEEIEHLGWGGVGEDTRASHRADVLQALAYSTLFDTPRVVACLVYPCRTAFWRELREKGRTLVRTPVRGGTRTVELALAAVPLSGDVEAAADDIVDLVHQAA